MKRLALAASVVALMSGCASDDWTRSDTAAELTWQALNVIDGYQTARFYKDPLAREGNPLSRLIISERPSEAEAWQLAAGYAISHYLISRSLPPKWRRWWQGGTLFEKSHAVYNNDRLRRERKKLARESESPPRLMSVIAVGGAE